VNLDAPQADAYLFELGDTVGSLVLGIDGNAPYARLTSAGAVIETPRSATIEQGAWVHLAVSAGGGELRVYVNGAKVAAAPAASLPEIGGTLTVGAGAGGGHFLSAQLDELQASNVVRSADWLTAAVASQGVAGTMLKYGEDSQAESGGGQSYFIITLKNVTVDGWVVIGILGVMSMVSWMIMIIKGMVIRRVRKDNAAFLRQFEAVGSSDPAALDRDDDAQDTEAQEHPLLAATSGEHDHFQSSTLYRLYHAGIHEVKVRVAGATVSAQRRRGITIESIDAIRAAMDAKLCARDAKAQRTDGVAHARHRRRAVSRSARDRHRR
jgi:biopolymer transport protein ExbB